MYSSTADSTPSPSENPIPERLNISAVSHERCEAIRRKFPGLGTEGVVRKIVALVSLSQNGYLAEPPDGYGRENRHTPRIDSSAFEIFTSSKGRYPVLFPTVVQLVAGAQLSYREIYQQVSWHIHLGSVIFGELAEQADSIEELYRLLLDKVPEGLSEVSSALIDSSEDGLVVQIGSKPSDNMAEVRWPLTDTSKTENPHACIVGVSGQGKTQFALDILYQIREQNPDVGFTILDYKGDLSEADSASRQMIETHLGCRIVTAGRDPIPTVPFQNTSSHNPDQYALGVTDLLGKFYPRLGNQQRQALRECLSALIGSPDFAGGFGFSTLKSHLEEYYEEHGRKQDGLTEVVSRLSVLRAFEETPATNNSAPLITEALLVRLNELTADPLPIAFLIVSRLYDEMRKLPDVERRGAVNDLRHVIFIDEAHHYLAVKSSPLARIIREGRSKGVAVFLATQSVSDLAGTGGADYREFISNSFFFKTNINRSTEIRALMPVADRKVSQISDAIATLDPGQMLFSRNLQQSIRNSVLQAVQFHQRGL